MGLRSTQNDGKQAMKLLLLGATGRTGKLALDYALPLGHEVVALVRDPAKVSVTSPPADHRPRQS